MTDAPATGHATETLDLARPRRVHVANVGGAGMSAVAVLLAESGHAVSGHDPAPSTPFLAMLETQQVAVTTGADPRPLPAEVEVVVVSTATPADDPAVVEALRRHIPVIHRAGALGALCARRTTLAVARLCTRSMSGRRAMSREMRSM